MKRHKLSSSSSRANFKSRAATHPKNTAPRPMRGGIRL